MLLNTKPLLIFTNILLPFEKLDEMKFLQLALLMLFISACHSPEKQTEEKKQDGEDKFEELSYNPDPAHYARVSLDYWGQYTGILPCADCEGIRISITLSKGEQFEIERQYIGKSEAIYTKSGTFQWDETGNIIELQGVEPPNKYFVSENRLFHLDLEGQRIRGDLEEKYTLNKTE